MKEPSNPEEFDATAIARGVAKQANLLKQAEFGIWKRGLTWWLLFVITSLWFVGSLYNLFTRIDPLNVLLFLMAQIAILVLGFVTNISATNQRMNALIALLEERNLLK